MMKHARAYMLSAREEATLLPCSADVESAAVATDVAVKTSTCG